MRQSLATSLKTQLYTFAWNMQAITDIKGRGSNNYTGLYIVHA